MTESIIFRPQEPIPPDDQNLYVTRPFDTFIDNLIARRDYAALIGPRLSGKTSVLFRQWARLSQSSTYLPVYLALGTLKDLPEPEWYTYLHRQIARQTNGLLPPPRDPAIHAPALEEEIAFALENELRGRVLVLMVDQVEMTPPHLGTGFFATLREMFVNRAMRPILRNLIAVLAGRFMPEELVKDPAISPFRVAEIVYVTDADLEGITHLIACLGTDRRQLASDVPARIYEWTEGDIYLTHKLCSGLARDVPEGAVMFADVDRAVRRYLFEDEMFRKMWRQLQADPECAALVETLLEHREPVRFTMLQRHIMAAWLEGAIKPDPAGNCTLRSLVHESVFYSMHRATQSTQAGHVRGRLAKSTSVQSDEPPLRGRYQLENVLRAGMTNYVYKATDMVTRETVAIKQLMVSREINEMAWHRFQRESEALKRLQHPHIVRFLDSFRDDDFEYIVMEYVYGGSLFDLLNREGRLALPLALDIASRLASALDHAHNRGIIHRDVKPSNIMLTADYLPRLADFGIARLNSYTRMTLPRTVIGTTLYLSPEGCLGETTDERGDIWSLGILLFEMLAGSPPFGGRSDDIISRAILESPLPDIRKIRPGVPDPVAEILQAMLTKPLGQRMQSALEVHEVLQSILDSLETTA